MKKAFTMPKIVVEQFVPNEYVSACGDSGTTYLFECNAGEKGHYYAVKDSNGNIATISGHYMDGGFWGSYYTPCHETHTAPSDSGFLSGYHIDDVDTWRDENLPVIIWTENGENVHCTTQLDTSKWETAKS